MRREDLTVVLLSIIAAALVGIAVRPIFAPRTAEAQSTVYPLYIEPGWHHPGLRKGDGGYADGKDLGVPDQRTTVLPFERTAEQAAYLASF
jgi:hypothetical protein